MRTLGERTRPAPVFFGDMDNTHAHIARLTSACEDAVNLVVDAAATRAAAQPIVALSDYEDERLEAAIKGSVVLARDGRRGMVKIAYATRKGSHGTSISVDFDGSGGGMKQQSDWSANLEKVALGCLTIGTSGGSQAAELALKASGVKCVLVPKFDSEKLLLGVAVGGGAPEFMDPLDALTITSSPQQN